jgi:hypothetical protein
LERIVTVRSLEFGEPLDGELVEVNDRGVVLRVPAYPAYRANDGRGNDAEPGAGETEPVLHFAPWNTLRLLTVTEDDLREHQERSEAEPQAAEEHYSTAGSNLSSPDLVKLDDFGGEVGEHWQNTRGRALLDKNGDEVGTVEELYVWKEPTTVHLIKVSGEEGSFLIPVHAVTSVDDDGVKLETARSKVTDSPEYGSDEVPDDEARRAAFDYFGYLDPLDL